MLFWKSFTSQLWNPGPGEEGVGEDTACVLGCSFSAIYWPSLELQGLCQKDRQYPGGAGPPVVVRLERVALVK